MSLENWRADISARRCMGASLLVAVQCCHFITLCCWCYYYYLSLWCECDRVDLIIAIHLHWSFQSIDCVRALAHKRTMSNSIFLLDLNGPLLAMYKERLDTCTARMQLQKVNDKVCPVFFSVGALRALFVCACHLDYFYLKAANIMLLVMCYEWIMVNWT